MTLICAYKNKQSTFIITDFRLTKDKDKKQYDRTIKFLGYGNILGIFLAGDVTYWKNVNASIHKYLNNISYENIFEIDKMFWQELSHQAIIYNGRSSGAIGFILNEDSHKLFKIEMFPQNGVEINTIPDNECIVIGSGICIPNISKILESIYDETYNYYKGDTYCIASIFRNRIVDEMKKLGSSSFKKLGISPIMSISILEKNYFKICGEEIRGGNYSSTEIFEYKYQFAKNSNNEYILTDESKGENIKIFDINKTDFESEKIFDPAKITNEYDPSMEFKDKSYIYMLEQVK